MEEGFKEWLLRDGFYQSMVLLNMDLLRKIFLGMILAKYDFDQSVFDQYSFVQ